MPLSLRAHRTRTVGVLAARAGDHPEAERLLRQAVDVFASWGSVPYRARAALDLAAVLDAQGRRDEAALVAAPAVADLERLGAWQWLAGSRFATAPVAAEH